MESDTFSIKIYFMADVFGSTLWLVLGFPFRDFDYNQCTSQLQTLLDQRHPPTLTLHSLISPHTHFNLFHLQLSLNTTPICSSCSSFKFQAYLSYIQMSVTLCTIKCLGEVQAKISNITEISKKSYNKTLNNSNMCIEYRICVQIYLYINIIR